MKKGKKCAGCGSALELPRVSLSRYDNDTIICSECGTYEAMIQFAAYQSGGDMKKALAAPGRAHADMVKEAADARALQQR